MNLSELARRLNTSVANLRERLPRMGFDVGKRAIKVDNVVAQQIMRKWRSMLREIEEQERKEALERLKAQKKLETSVSKVKLPSIITVRDFAAKMGLPVSLVISEMMKNGVFASINERIDYDTCAIIADDLGVVVEEDKEADLRDVVSSQEKVQKLQDLENIKGDTVRPPVVVIMGHVDHGKTTLLDKIRQSDVVSTESGGITQHIGAYQIEKKDRAITFIDTPGHEAFTAMRSRGARVADVAILVVAADDSVKPQTIESLRMIKDAGLSLVVAINKTDKPDANLDLVKTDLAKNNLVPEDWGGDTVCVPVSAKTGEGIDQLLDMVLLVADMKKDELLVNKDRDAAGTVIESNIDQNLGPVATFLVQVGTLKKNDYLVIDNVLFGKVRSMKDWHGKELVSAGPSMPVKVIGFKVSPKVGDIVQATDNKKNINLKKVKKQYLDKEKTISIVTAQSEETENSDKPVVNIIVKSDVLGSLEAIEESLEKTSHPEIAIKIIGKGLGSITESDILHAESSQAVVISFKVPLTQSVIQLAKDKGVDVLYEEVIFKLIDDIKIRMEDKLPPIITRQDSGKFKVLAVFRKDKDKVVIGGAIQEGVVKVDDKAAIVRDGKEISFSKINRLKSEKRDVKEMKSGQECGMELAGEELDIKENDEVITYLEEKSKRKLSDLK